MGWQLHRRVQLLRALTHRVCLNGAPWRAESYTVQPTPEHSQVALLNFAKAKFKGTQAAGPPCFGYFHWRSNESDCAAGRTSRHLREAQTSSQRKRARTTTHPPPPRPAAACNAHQRQFCAQRRPPRSGHACSPRTRPLPPGRPKPQFPHIPHKAPIAALRQSRP